MHTILRQRSRAKQAGFTVVEVMLALGLLIISVGTTAYLLRSNMASRESAQVGQHVLVLIDNIREHYRHGSVYTGLTETQALTERLVPEALITVTSGVQDVRWKHGDVTISSNTFAINPIAGAAGAARRETSFRVELSGIQREDCRQILTQLVPDAVIFRGLYSGGGVASVTVSLQTLTLIDKLSADTTAQQVSALSTAICTIPAGQTVTLQAWYL